MAFSHDAFAKTRPFVYHLTSNRNLQLILAERRLFSAATILRACGQEQWIRQKRPEIVTVTFRGHQMDIRDQAPLYEGKMSPQGGWSFEDVIEALNDRVFFWPGKDEGPIDYGIRHFERYEHENPAIVRVRTSELIAASERHPEFCKYNSGSPRTTQGTGSPRGPNTFVAHSDADFTAGAVREVTFIGSVALPTRIEHSTSPYGPWLSSLSPKSQ